VDVFEGLGIFSRGDEGLDEDSVGGKVRFGSGSLLSFLSTGGWA